MDAWIEYAKQNGPWAVMFFICLYALARASRWFASKVAEPLVGVVVDAVPIVAGAAVKMRDDVAEIKESTTRIEAQQSHCCLARAAQPPPGARAAPA